MPVEKKVAEAAGIKEEEVVILSAIKRLKLCPLLFFVHSMFFLFFSSSLSFFPAGIYSDTTTLHLTFICCDGVCMLLQ